MVEASKREKVYDVFQRISGTYDKANSRISLGLEQRWKQYLIDDIVAHVGTGDQVLDVCSGTGDIAIAIAKMRPDIAVAGLDFSSAMLEQAKKKSAQLRNTTWYEGDAMELPFENNRFGAACISFGLRNTADYAQVLREMTRVIRPDGWVYCLDSFVPDSWCIRPFYDLYFRGLMPFLGGGFHHRHEYQWLWQSTRDFLRKGQLTELFRQSGLTNIQMNSYLFGACVLHRGQKQ